jgi:phage FluMu gp28-like protein
MQKAPQSLFLPYQRRWIEDRAPLKIMEKSRQVGMSWASAYGLVREQVSKRENGYDCWVSSRDEIQAELFIEDCMKFAEVLHAGAELEDRTLLADANPLTARTLRFANGRAIHALSSNPNAQAGKRGTRLLDEFALHADPRELYTIALPGVTWGGRLEIVSTHRGENNFFNELILEITRKGNPKHFSYHRVTLFDALEQGFLARLKTKLPSDDPRQKMTEADYVEFIRSQCADEAAFQQEYCCQPAANRAQFLPTELVAGAEREGPLSPVSGSLFVGADLGRTHDATVFVLLERVGNRFALRERVVLRNEPFSVQEAALDALLTRPGCRGAALDASGLGRQFAERAAERHGAAKILPVVFTDDKKAALAYALKRTLEDHALELPAEADLRADLTSLELTTSASGNLVFDAPRSSAGHADSFWALALALLAAQRAERVSFGYASVERNVPSLL